jgi:hypothetical protein
MSLIGNDHSVFFDPPIEGRVANGDAALGHDLFKTPVGDTLTNVKINRVQDHGLRVMCAFETDQRFNPDIGFGRRIHWTGL